MKQTMKQYQAHVYHGGTLRGLGRWATGRLWASRERAEREGRGLADAASRIAGGSPIIEIVEVEDGERDAKLNGGG